MESVTDVCISHRHAVIYKSEITSKKSETKPGLAPAELQRLCYLLVNKGRKEVLQSQTLITTEPTYN